MAETILLLLNIFDTYGTIKQEHDYYRVEATVVHSRQNKDNEKQNLV